MNQGPSLAGRLDRVRPRLDEREPSDLRGPHFEVQDNSNVQAISSRLWSSGFLPSKYAGVAFRGAGDPVLYLSDPDGVDRETRRKMLDGLDKMNQIEQVRVGDPEIRHAHLAIRNGLSHADLRAGVDRYEPGKPGHDGPLRPDGKEPGTFAANCLLARRMVERGVRFVQIYHRGWDQHSNLPQ